MVIRVTLFLLIFMLGAGVLDEQNSFLMRLTGLILLVLITALGVAHLLMERHQRFVLEMLKDMAAIKEQVTMYERKRRGERT